MRTIRFLSLAIAMVAIGCGENTKGATPKVDAEAAQKGNGANAKKVVEDNAKANPGVKAAGPTGDTNAVP